MSLRDGEAEALSGFQASQNGVPTLLDAAIPIPYFLLLSPPKLLPLFINEENDAMEGFGRIRILLLS